MTGPWLAMFMRRKDCGVSRGAPWAVEAKAVAEGIMFRRQEPPKPRLPLHRMLKQPGQAMTHTTLVRHSGTALISSADSRSIEKVAARPSSSSRQMR